MGSVAGLQKPTAGPCLQLAALKDTLGRKRGAEPSQRVTQHRLHSPPDELLEGGVGEIQMSLAPGVLGSRQAPGGPDPRCSWRGGRDALTPSDFPLGSFPQREVVFQPPAPSLLSPTCQRRDAEVSEGACVVPAPREGGAYVTWGLLLAL